MAQKDTSPPEQTEQGVADKVEQQAQAVDATSTPGVPGVGAPPLETGPTSTTAEEVIGEKPGDDWPQLIFRGAGPSGEFLHIPAPRTQDQQIDQNGPSGRSYHFRQHVVHQVHPDDLTYFLGHKALRFERPGEDEAIG